MKYFTKFINPAALFSIFVFVALIISEPKTCTQGASEGILLCGRVIIPALFPFTVCVLFILKSGFLNALNFTAPLTTRVFHFSPEMFTIMLLSFAGGYPIGAKLLNEMVTLKKIDSKTAGLMLNYCVNAGPAFIVLAVGSGIIGSKVIGYILLASHIIASFILALIFGRFINKSNFTASKSDISLNVMDNFVVSTSDAATALINICAYVVLFSTIISYIELLSQKIHYLKFLSFILEVTNAIGLTNNILIISFLLGFGGICVWCQILSLGRKIRICIPVFILSRILHGLLSVVLTSVLMKVLNVSISVISSGKSFSMSYSYTTVTLSISMICMAIVLLISLYTKKFAGKILEDLI